MIDIIKKIREQTGLSVSEIKNALEEAGGDEQRALKILNTRGHMTAEKKASRETGQGVVGCYVHSNKKVGAIVVLRCETDFVAKSPDFLELAHDLAMQIASMDPKDEEELLSQPFIKDQNLTVKELIEGNIAKLGENIKIGGFSRFSV